MPLQRGSSIQDAAQSFTRSSIQELCRMQMLFVCLVKFVLLLLLLLLF